MWLKFSPSNTADFEVYNMVIHSAGTLTSDIKIKWYLMR